jgi:protease I
MEIQTMANDTPLEFRRILVFVGDDYEDLEVWYPKLRLEEAGAYVALAGAKAGVIHKGKHGYPCITDAAIIDTEAIDYDGVILAGGWMPDKLRRDPKVLQIIRDFHTANKMIAAICHGGWLAISAKVYHGVRVTGSPGIKDDLENAGALWEDAPVVVDRHFISSRKPGDLPAFCKAMVRMIEAQPAR